MEANNHKIPSLPHDWKMYGKYQIRHTDGTPLKGESYFVLRLDSDDPTEKARVAAAMAAYKGELQTDTAKILEAVNKIYDLLSKPAIFLEEVRQACREARAVIYSSENPANKE